MAVEPATPVGPADSAAHHDEARAKVPSTSIATCWLRALESRKPPEERLAFDPFAERLCGGKPIETVVPKSEYPEEFWVNMMAVRTRWGDDEIVAARPQQVVILGAGLDARAWRMQELKGVPVFEVDFPEVLGAKSTLLESSPAVAELHQVGANLGVDDWPERLVAAGFDKERPSFWLLEGLTGYLTADELQALFDKVASLAAADSRMAATFTGAKSGQATNMHRTFWQSESDVEDFLRRHSWEPKVRSVWDVVAEYGRGGFVAEGWKYYLATASMSAGAAAKRRRVQVE